MAQVPADNDRYEALEVIGRGAFGTIRKVRRKADQQILCRKEINYLKMSPKERDQLQAEFNILSSLKNPYIVQYYHREHIKQTQELYMYMEYCGGGDLGGCIKELKKSGKLAREEFVWKMLSQILTALYRCHYGVDPPEPRDAPRAKDGKLPVNRSNPTILHRDLKPENIFLNDDKDAKLGDFGLSKIIQAHDFASTYVGTPFYMSPEICQAERYTAKSDIWALGCIMYELCTGEPPFNAQTHIQLVNKIRKGETAPLPSTYSQALGALIKSCLQVNPMYRPDTETLLNHERVWLARKQHDTTRMCKMLADEREILNSKLKQAEERIAALEANRISVKTELEAQLRREWEVKARLEIDRQVELETQRKFDTLQSQFDEEVNRKVKEQLVKYSHSSGSANTKETDSSTSTLTGRDHHKYYSSVTTSEESEWTNTTDLTELSDLSIHSPTASTTKQPPAKKTKTPFTRSKTTFDSPTDIQMADPSPISITSLNLSPRRHTADTNRLQGKSLFNKIATNKARMVIPDDLLEDEEKENFEYSDDDDDDDAFPDLPSPTRPKMQNTDPFKMPPPSNIVSSKARPNVLQRQHTIATTNRLATRPTLFPTTGTSSTAAQVRAGIAAANNVTCTISASQPTTTTQPSQIPRSATESDMKRVPSSPTAPTTRGRRLSKIPSRGDLAAESAHHAIHGTSTSPIRRAATVAADRAPAKLMSKVGANTRQGISEMSNNVVAGRTRVELAQARAGGRPMSAHLDQKALSSGAGNGAGIRVVEKELPPVPIWDPEVLGEDAMPSPFLKRDVKSLPRGLR